MVRCRPEVFLAIEDDEFLCCPKLEDVEIGGLTGNVSSYRNFVTTRWNISGRTIKSMVFLNCKGIDARRTRFGLKHIPDVEACVREGLDLDVCYNKSVGRVAGRLDAL